MRRVHPSRGIHHKWLVCIWLHSTKTNVVEVISVVASLICGCHCTQVRAIQNCKGRCGTSTCRNDHRCTSAPLQTVCLHTLKQLFSKFVSVAYQCTGFWPRGKIYRWGILGYVSVALNWLCWETWTINMKHGTLWRSYTFTRLVAIEKIVRKQVGSRRCRGIQSVCFDVENCRDRIHIINIYTSLSKVDAHFNRSQC